MKQNILGCSNILFLLLFLISFTTCDLPVHCLVSDIKGEWVMRISKEVFDAKPEDTQTTCNHGLPDMVDKTVGDVDITFKNYYDQTITLDDNYKVYENGVQTGTWTPVYDQSFVIYHKDSIFTAAYKYFLNHRNVYQSNCSKTMVGWYIPDNNQNTNNWSCFFAFKKDPNMRSFLQLETKTNESVTSLESKHKTRKLHSSLKYEHLHGVVTEINKADLEWKAEVHDEFKGLNLNQLKSHLGLRNKDFTFYNPQQNFNFIQMSKNEDPDKEVKNFFDKIDQDEKEFKNKVYPSPISVVGKNLNLYTSSEEKSVNPIIHAIRDKDSNEVTDYDEVVKYLNKPLDQINEVTLPKNWDWRNVGGVNYVPTIKKQGNCGSCYVFSTMTCLESRLRIQTNNADKTEFSKQYPISCNFYSEGCDGGYPFLVGKFLNEFEVVPDSCFKYTQSNGNCKAVCDYKTMFPDRKYKVSKYGYLGGFYGATDETLMMKELRANGPIPGNIRVPYHFNYYKKGIFSEKSLKNNADKLSKTTMVDRHLSWEKVEHSVTLIGYGEENGVKYWIGMNTWGQNWGENGFFKILRGENDCSVESMGDYIQIEYGTR